MTREEYRHFATSPVLSHQNPAFILNHVTDELLVMVIAGEIDLKELAKREMENRGLNENGQWVGYDKQIK